MHDTIILGSRGPKDTKFLLENPGLAARISNLVGAPIEKGFELLPKKWNEVHGFRHCRRPLRVAASARTLVVMKWALAAALWLSVTSCASEATFHGRYYFGHEVRSFHPCGSKKAYWVSADEDISKVLRDRAERLRERRGKRNQPVYVEVVGEIDLKTKREGFAEDYDGLFHLRKLVRVSDTVPKECEK